jgi:hypothetical protein
MRIINKTLLTFLLTLWVLVLYGSSTKSDSLRFEVLLTSKMLNDIHLNERLINSIDITSNRLILLSTTDQFYLLGWGGIVPFGKKVTGNITSYAFTPDSLLMIIRNNELCGFDSLGNLSRLFTLPGEEMGISAGKYVMYAYNRTKVQANHAIYVIARGGKYSKLVEVPAAINSVIEMNNSILFATGNAVLCYDLRNKVLKALTALPKDKEVKSIAVNSSSNMIYLSTENSIYALKDSSAVVITEEFGGVLWYYNDGLLVFNPSKKFLVRITGIEENITSKMLALNNPVKRETINKNFYIIAGSYPTEQQANDAISDLKRKGFPEALLVGKNSYGSYRIAYKAYATNDEAAKDITKIKQTINPSSWIFEKK